MQLCRREQFTGSPAHTAVPDSTVRAELPALAPLTAFLRSHIFGSSQATSGLLSAIAAGLIAVTSLVREAGRTPAADALALARERFISSIARTSGGDRIRPHPHR